MGDDVAAGGRGAGGDEEKRKRFVCRQLEMCGRWRGGGGAYALLNYIRSARKSQSLPHIYAPPPHHISPPTFPCEMSASNCEREKNCENYLLLYNRWWGGGAVEIWNCCRYRARFRINPSGARKWKTPMIGGGGGYTATISYPISVQSGYKLYRNYILYQNKMR